MVLNCNFENGLKYAKFGGPELFGSIKKWPIQWAGKNLAQTSGLF
jgi:hypothetical protein